MVAGSLGRIEVALALLRRHSPVASAVHQELGYTQRQELHGRSDGVDGLPIRIHVQEVGNSAVPKGAQSAASRSATPAKETVAAARTKGTAPGAPSGNRWRPAAQSARCPPAEWPSTTTRERSRLWASASAARWSMPAATSSAVSGQPPVLQVPSGVAAGRDVAGEAVHQIAFEALPPEAAVEQHYHGDRASALRQAQVAHLVGVRAVGDGANGRRQDSHSGGGRSVGAVHHNDR